MSTEVVLHTKLFSPPPRRDLVPRPRLVQSLNEGLYTKRKLTLVSAPAGFGKTTLVLAWIKENDHPAAWLSLDEADNDLVRFLTYLVAALQQVDERIGALLLGALQSPQLPAIEKVLTTLLNEIALRTDPLILVLDDYHLLTETAILEVMEFLLLHQPPLLHLVLTTREDPDLPLARLRAQDQLTEIRARDLQFTQEETVAFLRDVMGLELSQQEVVALENRTEGWAVGLQLAGLSMQKQDDLKAFIADFSGSNRHILDYLTDEVLQQQSENMRIFLLQTAILDRLNGQLCDMLTERTDSERLLAQLEAANLFVIPLDEERRWYRYHHLFSDLLLSQLNRSQPELVPELHRRASRWYEENGDIQTAIDHALQASDLTRAARLIEQHALPKLYQGQVSLVGGWCDRLPEKILEITPMLCICKAWALVLTQGGARRGEVEPVLLAADLALDRVKAGEALRELVGGHAASIRAFIQRIPALRSKKPEKLIALSQEAQRLLPQEEKAIRSTTTLNMGYGYLALADLEAASLAFNQTLEDGLSGANFYAAIYGPINLAIIAILQGYLKTAMELCETYIDRFNQIRAGQYFPPIGALYILKGNILLESDCLAEAEMAMKEGLDLIRWTGEFVAPKKGYTALARLHALRGDQPAMQETLKTLEETWPEGALYVQALRYRLLMRYWSDEPDVQKDAYTWLAQSGIEFDELAVIDGVDPVSTTYFESYLNAAYVVTRLEKEKPGGYPLEGVLDYLKRQQDFATTRGFASWVVDISIARTLLYQAAGKKFEALEMLEVALSNAVSTGLLRVFVEEGEPLRDLLKELKPRLADHSLIAYADRLLEGFRFEPEKPETESRYKALLSERELEVLRCLATGLTYEEIGRQLYLSLNTVQFHVKNIYGKLLVNKRMQAIEKAREMELI
jgi:LuxR family maltose regulon positive regulatory protein